MSQQWFLDQSRQGNAYNACSTGAVTLSTVSVTCTGLVLSNPFGSNKDLVVWKVSFQPSTAPAGVSLVSLVVSPIASQTAVVHTTPIVIHNSRSLGSDTQVGVGRVDSAATLPDAPVYLRPIGGVTAASSITPSKYEESVDGSIILSPGSNLSLSFLTTAALGVASISWVEADIVT